MRYIFGILLLAFCMTGCGQHKPDFAIIYYIKQDSSSVRYYPTKKPLTTNAPLQETVTILLTGPDEGQKLKHISTEIPSNTKLLSTRETDKYLIIDLSGDFAKGGGSLSMSVRLNQLIKTIKSINPKKPVVLYIDGQQVESIGGEGIAIDYPLYTPSNWLNRINPSDQHKAS